MMKTKVRFCKVRSPQIKKCKKETSFKIQFYIGIHLSGIVLGCFSDLSAMSPSPNIQVYLKLMSAKRVAKVLLVSVADFVSFSFVEHNNNNDNKDDKDCSRIPLLGRAPL